MICQIDQLLERYLYRFEAAEPGPCPSPLRRAAGGRIPFPAAIVPAAVWSGVH